jgi:hypothetical protein
MKAVFECGSFTHAHLNLILSNLQLFPVGVLFAFCVASPCKNLSLGPSLVATPLFMLYLGQNNAWWL